MIRFGIDNERFEKEFKSDIGDPPIGVLIFFISFVLGGLISLIFVVGLKMNSFLYIFLFSYVYMTAWAFIKLFMELYNDPKYFILDIIPLIGIGMRLYEKFLNIYLYVKKKYYKAIEIYKETERRKQMEDNNG